LEPLYGEAPVFHGDWTLAAGVNFAITAPWPPPMLPIAALLEATMKTFDSSWSLDAYSILMGVIVLSMGIKPWKYQKICTSGQVCYYLLSLFFCFGS